MTPDKANTEFEHDMSAEVFKWKINPNSTAACYKHLTGRIGPMNAKMPILATNPGTGRTEIYKLTHPTDDPVCSAGTCATWQFQTAHGGKALNSSSSPNGCQFLLWAVEAACNAGDGRCEQGGVDSSGLLDEIKVNLGDPSFVPLSDCDACTGSSGGMGVDIVERIGGEDRILNIKPLASGVAVPPQKVDDTLVTTKPYLINANDHYLFIQNKNIAIGPYNTVKLENFKYTLWWWPDGKDVNKQDITEGKKIWSATKNSRYYTPFKKDHKRTTPPDPENLFSGVKWTLGSTPGAPLYRISPNFVGPNANLLAEGYRKQWDKLGSTATSTQTDHLWRFMSSASKITWQNEIGKIYASKEEDKSSTVSPKPPLMVHLSNGYKLNGELILPGYAYNVVSESVPSMPAAKQTVPGALLSHIKIDFGKIDSTNAWFGKNVNYQEFKLLLDIDNKAIGQLGFHRVSDVGLTIKKGGVAAPSTSLAAGPDNLLVEDSITSKGTVTVTLPTKKPQNIYWLGSGTTGTAGAGKQFGLTLNMGKFLKGDIKLFPADAGEYTLTVEYAIYNYQNSALSKVIESVKSGGATAAGDKVKIEIKWTVPGASYVSCTMRNGKPGAQSGNRCIPIWRWHSLNSGGGP